MHHSPSSPPLHRYEATVKKVEPAKERVRVHFLGWSSRHDRNYKHGSADIRLICTAEEA